MYDSFNRSKIYSVILVLAGLLLVFVDVIRLVSGSSELTPFIFFLTLVIGIIILFVGISIYSLNKATREEMELIRIEQIQLRKQINAIEDKYNAREKSM